MPAYRDDCNHGVQCELILVASTFLQAEFAGDLRCRGVSGTFARDPTGAKNDLESGAAALDGKSAAKWYSLVRSKLAC